MKSRLPFQAVHADGVPGILSLEREPFFRLALEQIGPDERVLDVGAGDGGFARLRGTGETCQMDANPDNVRRLREEFDHVVEAALPALPFEDASFDVVHCSHVMEHLAPQDVYDSLKEIDRCLKPGGKLILSMPILWQGFYDDLSHVKPYSRHVFLKYLCNCYPSSLTRPPVSAGYVMVAATVRYRRCAPVVILVERRGLLARLVRKGINLAARLSAAFGVRRLVATGETLVFVKGV